MNVIIVVFSQICGLYMFIFSVHSVYVFFWIELLTSYMFIFSVHSVYVFFWIELLTSFFSSPFLIFDYLLKFLLFFISHVLDVFSTISIVFIFFIFSIVFIFTILTMHSILSLFIRSLYLIFSMLFHLNAILLNVIIFVKVGMFSLRFLCFLIFLCHQLWL